LIEVGLGVVRIVGVLEDLFDSQHFIVLSSGDRAGVLGRK
jgi:hypothetical protein